MPGLKYFFSKKKPKVSLKYNVKNSVSAIIYENKIIVFQKSEIILAVLGKQCSKRTGSVCICKIKE